MVHIFLLDLAGDENAGLQFTFYLNKHAVRQGGIIKFKRRNAAVVDGQAANGKGHCGVVKPTDITAQFNFSAVLQLNKRRQYSAIAAA